MAANFNAARTTAFFTQSGQMSLTAAQRTALSAEGLARVDDFVDFTEVELNAAFKNMRAANPPVPVSAKSSSRLIVAALAHQYYTTTGRDINHNNMHFTNVLRSFYIEWKAIEELSTKDSDMKMPTLSKNCPPLKWCESMKHFLSNTFGVRKIPLTYIIRENVDVAPEAPAAGQQRDPNVTYDPLEANKAYGNSGSVLGDLVARATHTHPLYKSDNSKVFSLIEQAARNSSYLSTIKPFESTKNGRGAWKAILTAHVGDSKWIHIQKENSKWLINAKWNGQKIPLEMFVSQHRAKFQQLEEAAGHVRFQTPTEHTRVGYLLDNIETSDAGLAAALAQVRNDHDGSRSNFERAVQILMPMDPFARNEALKNEKKVTFAIHAAEGTVQSKNGRGAKTGVDLRWHPPNEFMKLPGNQKKELLAFQSTAEGKKAIAAEKAQYFKEKRKRKNDNGGGGGSMKKVMARVAALEQEKEERSKEKEMDENVNLIAAAIQKSMGSQRNSSGNFSQSMAREIMGIVARSASKQDQSS